MTPAQSLTKAIREVLATDGWMTFKVGSTAARNSKGDFYRTGSPGAPDLVAVKGQRYILIEVKAGKDKLRPAQLAFRQEVERVFGNYIVARGVTDVIDFLEGLP